MHNVVIKENEIVFVCDQSGDVSPQAEGGLGLYFRDTRFLSELGLEVNGTRPLLLSSSGEQNFLSNLQCANPAWVLPDGTSIPPQTVSIRRDRLVEGGLHERIGLFNYTQRSVPIEIRLSFRADFRDIFDIRQFGGEIKRGHFETPELTDSGLDLSYLGLDRVRRRTEIRFEPAPDELIPSVVVAPGVGPSPAESYLTSSVSRDEDRGPGGTAIFRVLLQSQESSTITFRVIPVVGDEQPSIASFETVAHTVQSSYQRWEADSTLIETSNSTFNRLLRRSQLDLRALLVRRETGLYPDAGIPWFAVPFGRDGLITAYQALLLSPEIAVGTLRYLAQHQGQRVDPWRDEQPGKILHEMRFGELAGTGQVPHSPYYGAIDTTPLFLVLFCELMDWLDDDALYRELIPAIRLALDWIDRFGDLDGDGYLEWQQWGPASLYNQAWKDSHDSYFYADGSATEQPTASAEIQGYVYDAKVRLAALYSRKGDVELGAELGRQAAALRERFNRDFWVAEEQFFAQALDGQKRQVTSVSTNPGHCLWSGLLDPDRAAAVAKRLLADDLFSGWGIRTLSSRSPRFNPMSYHNGSIWPHDNSLIAAGLRRYGHDEAANTIITGIFRAGLRFHELRLPELFCGFTRDEVFHSMPAEYPVACNPQAWAAGSPLLFVRTILGLQPDAARRRLTLRPHLPEWLEHVRLTKVQVGLNFVDLMVSSAGVETTRNTGNVEIVVELGVPG